MTVAELDDRVSSLELTHWQAFFKLENEDVDRRARRAASPAASDDE